MEYGLLGNKPEAWIWGFAQLDTAVFKPWYKAEWCSCRHGNIECRLVARVNIADQAELEAPTGNEGQAGRGRVPLAEDGLGCCKSVATVVLGRWGEQGGVVRNIVVESAMVCAIKYVAAFATLEAAKRIPNVLIVVVAGSLVEDDGQARQGCD